MITCSLDKSKILKVILGILLIIIGLVTYIVNWRIYYSMIEDGYLYYISLISAGTGTYLLVSVYCKNKLLFGSLSFLVPLLIIASINIYSDLIIIPKIEKQGLTCTGKVIELSRKVGPSGSSYDSFLYEYDILDKKYVKEGFNHYNLKDYDTFKVKYLESNPNFHICYFTDKTK